MSSDNDKILARLDAIELALTYGLRTRDTRDNVTCALHWAKEYTEAYASNVWMGREELLASATATWFRSHVKFVESIGRTVDQSPSMFYLTKTFGHGDPVDAARFVLALERLTWADFGAKAPS